MNAANDRMLEPPAILTDPATHRPLYRTVDGAWMSLDGSRFVAPEDAADFEAEALAYATDPDAGKPRSCWPDWTDACFPLALDAR